MEEWKDIKGYEDHYQISNFGNVRNKSNNNQLKTRKHSNGYLRFCLSKGGITKDFYAHRLVASAFIDNVLNKMDVNHIDGNKTNNNVINLEWATRSENQKHAFSTGLNRISDEHKKANAIFNSKQVVDLQTGFFFDSLKEACVSTNRSYAAAKNHIRKNSKLKRFQYV